MAFAMQKFSILTKSNGYSARMSPFKAMNWSTLKCDHIWSLQKEVEMNPLEWSLIQ